MTITNELRSVRSTAYDKMSLNTTKQSSEADATKKSISWGTNPNQTIQIPALSRPERLSRMIGSSGCRSDSTQEYIDWKIADIFRRHPEMRSMPRHVDGRADSSLQTKASRQRD